MVLGSGIRALLDVAWVAGAPQYHYARKLGYKHSRIVSNLLSADPEMCKLSDGRARRFLFVGRFHPVKGLRTLIEAYKIYRTRSTNPWPLTLIGDGPLRKEMEESASVGIDVLPYLQPSELKDQLACGGVGVLPSRFEPWGVSLHEMATSGLPLIASFNVGAASEFLIDGFNGFLISVDDPADLADAFFRMAASSDDERAEMGIASQLLSKRVSPKIAAASLLSASSIART